MRKRRIIIEEAIPNDFNRPMLMLWEWLFRASNEYSAPFIFILKRQVSLEVVTLAISHQHKIRVGTVPSSLSTYCGYKDVERFKNRFTDDVKWINVSD